MVDIKYANKVKMIKKLIAETFPYYRVTYSYDRYTKRWYFKFYCYGVDYIFKIVPDMKWEIFKSNIESCLKKHYPFIFHHHKDDDNDSSFWEDYFENNYNDNLYDDREEDDEDDIVMKFLD